MSIGLHSVVAEAADFEAAVRDFARLLGRGPVFRIGPNGPPAAGESAAPAAPASALFEFPTGAFEVRSSADERADARSGLVGLRLRFDASPGSPFVAGRLSSPTVPIELVAEASISRGALLRHSSDAAEERDSTEPAGRILGLDHVVITTRDPDRLRGQLVDQLGIRLALDRTFPERRLRLLFFRIGGITLEAATPASPEPGAAEARGAGASGAEAGPDGFGGLAWKVAGLDPLRARLLDEGFDVSTIRPGFKPATRVCSVRAPVHGVPTLLIEHPPVEPGAAGSTPKARSRW